MCIFNSIKLCAIVIASLPCLALGSISLSPAHTDLSYSGVVTLTTSVSNGASATIDIFFDNNANGSINTGELAWRHYTVTDGQLVPPTGALLVTDTDGLANGSLTVPILNFENDNRIAGHFVVRVKSGSSTSTAAFVNDPPATSQSVAGQLQLDGTGQPGAAILLDGEGSLLYPVLTDASGNYTLPIPAAGNYQIGGLILNEAGCNRNGVPVTISAGQKKTGVKVALTKAAYRLKGQLIRSDTSQGVPYAWLELEDEAAGGWAVGISDSSGNFDLGLGDGTWAVEVSAMEKLGFMQGAFTDGTSQITVNDATVAGTKLTLTPISGFVTARARNGATNEYLAGVKLVAAQPGTFTWKASATSDANGYLALGVAAGQWDIYPMLDSDNDLYKTMIYPSNGSTVTVTTSESVYNVGTIDILPADALLTVQVVDEAQQPQSGIYVYGCDQGISQSYTSNAGATDGNGQVTVPVRHDNTWFIGVNVDNQNLTPPQHRLDVLSEDGNVITLYPRDYRLRPYRVYGGSGTPASLDYPQDSGFTYLGRGVGTATFAGGYPSYCLVAYDGKVLIDSVMGARGVFYAATDATQTVDLEKIAGIQDKQYAIVGDNSDQATVGAVLIQCGTTVNGLTVIHPDQPINAVRDWLLY